MGNSFSIFTTLNESWSLVKGNKKAILYPVVLYYLAMIVLVILAHLILPSSTQFNLTNKSLLIGQHIHEYLYLYWRTQTATALVFICSSPILTGIFMLGVGCARKESIQDKKAFRYYRAYRSLFLAAFFWIIALNALPGIYSIFILVHLLPVSQMIWDALITLNGLVGLPFIYVLVLIVDKGLSPWQGFITSAKKVLPKYFSLLILLFITTLINALGVFTFGIGLIWTLPLSIITIGVFYRDAIN